MLETYLKVFVEISAIIYYTNIVFIILRLPYAYRTLDKSSREVYMLHEVFEV